MNCEILQDVRFGARQLFKNPGFTAVAVLTLALGIGANSAIFSMVNALLLRPLPVRDPGRLVWIENDLPSGGLSGITSRVSIFQEWQRQNKSFESMAGYFAFFDYWNTTLESDGEPVRIQGVAVTGNFLETLGVRPRLGRDFSQEESVWNGRGAVILTDAFWRRRFQARPDIVGHSIHLTIGGEGMMWSHTNADSSAAADGVEVVGVLPPSFDFSSIFTPGSPVDFIYPFPLCDQTDRWGDTLAVVARLKPGATLPAAQAEFDWLNQQLRQTHSGGFGARMTALPQKINGQFRRAFLVLFAAVGCVLLIACANLSNLLLARSVARRREFAVRVALGAGRGRLVRQMLTESLLLSLGGAALGLPMAWACVSGVAQSRAFNIPLLRTVTIDSTALGFTLAIAFASALLFGILPALQISAMDIQEGLRDSTRGSGQGRGRAWVREALIAAQVAAACILMVGAGLLLRSFLRFIEVDPGFRPEQAAAWSIQPSRSFANTEEQTAYFNELVRVVGALPGVESAGMSDALPLGRNRSWWAAAKGEMQMVDGKTNAVATIGFPRIVDTSYIRTMRIPLRAGRDFDSHDAMPSAQKVAVINETMARRLWPGRPAVGRIMSTGGGDFEIIGVASDVKHAALEESSGGEMYLLGAQNGWSTEDLVVRTKASLASLVPAVRGVLRGLDARMPVDSCRSLGQIVDKAVSPRRFIVTLMGLFSALALILASVGVYGVISYAVTQRTAELGIRLALGATTRGILWLVIFQGMRPVALGLLIGLGGAAALTQIARSLLFGVSATDPLTFAANGLLFVGVGLLACWLPARRAAKVDPIVALRNE
jgi:putative ABC transport system permease protein